jgi:hypothetical protein
LLDNGRKTSNETAAVVGQRLSKYNKGKVFSESPHYLTLGGTVESGVFCAIRAEAI